METLIQALITQGSVGIVAALALVLLDRSYKDRLKEAQEQKETYRADRAELIAVIKENAKTMTALQSTVETSQRAIEALIYDRTENSRTRRLSASQDT